MAITTYSELVTALGAWTNTRSDLTALWPDFIALFEARMNRLIRVPEMEAESTSTTTEETLALPTDFLAIREVRVDGEAVPSMNPQALRQLYLESTASSPLGYTIVGTNLLFQPAPSSSIEVGITYFQKIPALTSTNTTNWLLDKYPDIYLYGTLCTAQAYLRDDERLAVWKGAWDEALGELERAGIKARLPSTPLVMRPGVYE